MCQISLKPEEGEHVIHEVQQFSMHTHDKSDYWGVQENTFIVLFLSKVFTL